MPSAPQSARTTAIRNNARHSHRKLSHRPCESQYAWSALQPTPTAPLRRARSTEKTLLSSVNLCPTIKTTGRFIMPSPEPAGGLPLSAHKNLALIAAFAFAAILAAPALHAQSDAESLFSHAKAEAAQQHKNVLLVFSASWCGPCKLYERFLEDPQMQSITDKAFVLQRFDVGERPGDPKHTDTPGAVKLRTALGAAGEPGFPWIVITDEHGNPIVNSYRDGNTNANVGYPAAPEEIDWYIDMLKRAAPSLSSADLAATRDWLRSHSPLIH